jgi:hypothetical protein
LEQDSHPAGFGVADRAAHGLATPIEAPQAAARNVYEALQGGDPAAIGSALQAGAQSVGAAMVQFPGAVIDDIVGASTNLGTDTGAPAALL